MAGVLSVTEPATLASVGTRGGSMTPSSFVFTLQNTGDDSLDWSTDQNGGGLVQPYSPDSGTLGVSESVEVTVSFPANIAGNDVGDYSSVAVFIDDTNGPEIEKTISWTINGGRRQKLNNASRLI